MRQKPSTRCAVAGTSRSKFAARFFEIGRGGTARRAEPQHDQGAHGGPFEAERFAEDQDRIVAFAHHQLIDGGDPHARHRRQRGDGFLILMRLGKAEQRGFVQFAGVVQLDDGALRRREIARRAECGLTRRRFRPSPG